ncbi:hypothetical protein SAMN05421835_12396 [Amycolatopsis sacchari]|uniref:Methyltransferase domain-containing protein n=1 Tax=Amycolatopsis sacchari TaxID=115433 RepID=A0A1I4AAI6_9PSEU|nr:DNA modification methylase [Amycolatopsis sacchari]SFK53323.1 hypothetical protein SAMN05421835_12396 [Amycolatopsis sacchari]
MPDSFTRAGSVWDTGALTVRQQLKDRYLGVTIADTSALTPAVARWIIATYTRAGDTVLDPQPGAGVALCEALRARRHAVGIRPGYRWQTTCEANLTLARRAGANSNHTLLDHPGDTRVAELPAAVDLVLTSLRHTPAADPSRAVSRLQGALTPVANWVWPGGHVVITCRPWRQRDELVDLAGRIEQVAQACGLVPVDQCVALTKPLRTAATHLDVLVFAAPTAAVRSAAEPAPSQLAMAV